MCNKNGIDFLEELKRISLKDIIMKEENGWVDYKTTNGKARSVGILQEDGISCAKVTLKKGDTFEAHNHSMFEVIIIVSGKGIFYIDGKEEINYRDHTVIQVGGDEVHSMSAEEETKFIVANLPKNKDFPSVKKGV